LAECVELQEQAVSHLQVMYWAVRACADDPATFKRTQEVHQMYETVSSSYKSNRPAPGPTSAEVSSSVHASAELSSRKWSMLAKTEDEGIETVFRATQKKVAESKVSSESKENSHPVAVVALSPSPGAAGGDPLLPLEGSFIEVGHYVSVVVSFLRTALQDIGAGTAPRVPRGAKKGPRVAQGKKEPPKSGASANTTLEALGEVRRWRVQSHTDFLGIHIAREELAQVLHDVDLLSKVEAQHEVALFSRFQSILERLLKEVVDSVATTVVINGVRVRTPRQNKKVKIVNAMIASTMDLVRALRGLASVVSKLRAHRDIRVTQSGTKEL
jgi:hypothetical protein